MMTSWNELRKTEAYLFGKLSQEESLLFEAKILTDPFLRIRVAVQKRIYLLVKMYGRKKLKSRLGDTHTVLFSDSSRKQWQSDIHQLFVKK